MAVEVTFVNVAKSMRKWAGLIRTLNFSIPYCKRVKRFYGQLISLEVKFMDGVR